MIQKPQKLVITNQILLQVGDKFFSFSIKSADYLLSNSVFEEF